MLIYIPLTKQLAFEKLANKSNTWVAFIPCKKTAYRLRKPMSLCNLGELFIKHWGGGGEIVGTAPYSGQNLIISGCRRGHKPNNFN